MCFGGGGGGGGGRVFNKHCLMTLLVTLNILTP